MDFAPLPYILGIAHKDLDIALTNLAGIPAQSSFDGILLVTTLPAATTEFVPMLQPGRIVAPAPIQALGSIKTPVLCVSQGPSRYGDP